MDAYEATRTVMSRIKSLDPENTSKIMGYILLQDQGEKEMIRLAFGPESLLMSYINQAKAFLRLPSNGASSDHNPVPQTSPRILIPSTGYHFSNPSSPAASFPRNSPRTVSYAAVLNGSNTVSNNSTSGGAVAPSLHFYGGNDFGEDVSGVTISHQVQDQLPFLDESVRDPVISPGGRSDSLYFPLSEDHVNSIASSGSPLPFHRRSCSVNDAALLSNLEDGGGWRPCMYFARGFCKNGSTCKFLHSDSGEGEAQEQESPGKNGASLDELLKIRALQQQRFALMALGGRNHFPYNNCLTFPNENLRNEFSAMGLCYGGNSSSRQIYLTFPSDSTFKEEDVSGYFNTFGPVQDVRIPYQQKRMFGFVTFVYSETVKLILAKGNPHFVCDSRVLVKPYKEKGKVLDKKQHELIEVGDYPPSDSREWFDIPIGSRMLSGAQELMIRRKLEQEAELQHSIELQSRRMMDLQLNQHSDHPFALRLPACYPHLPPRQSQYTINQNLVNSTDKLDFDGISTSQADDVNGDLNPEPDVPRRLEDSLPDNLFTSPTKLGSPLGVASNKSCYYQIPRFYSGQEAIEM